MSRRVKALNRLKDADDIFFLLTGTRISKVVGRGIALFGDDIMKKFSGQGTQPAPDPNDPYQILGVRPDASDMVVKAAYRAWARHTHPDTSQSQGETAFQKIQEAYDTIMRQRHNSPSSSSMP